jgi:formate-dependent nitrite reductase membrane component NrfD
MSLGEMPWNIPLWFDIWLAGMAGGAYLAAFLADRYSGGAHKNLFRLAVYTGVPLAIIGVLLLVIDLGNPLWFWHLFATFKPVAVMSMGTWILLTWVIIAFIMMITWVVEGDATRKPELYPSNMAGKMQRISGFLGWVDLVLAALLMTYPGVLLASTSQAMWSSTLLLPAIFVASAICTGVALLILMALVINAANRSSSNILNSTVKWLFGSTGWTISRETIGQLAKALVWVIAIELVVMVGYAIWLGVSGAAGASEALSLLTAGSLALPFWLAVVLLGLLIPLVLLVINRGEVLAAKATSSVIVASATCVLLGGLALRAVMIMGGQL